MERFLPCKICGAYGEVKIFQANDSRIYFVECPLCKRASKRFEGHEGSGALEQAIESWNEVNSIDD